MSDEAMGGQIVDEEVVVVPAGVCTRFVFSRCRKGDACRFSHDVDRSALLARTSVAEVPPVLSRSVATAKSGESQLKLLEPEDGSCTTESAPKAWRSIDWMLRGDSVTKNPYLQEFASASWMPELLKAPECASLWNMRGRSLRKELSEAFGALHACRRALQKLEIADFRGATILDLCCGKGFGSLVLALALPEARVVAVDTNPNMDLAHFRLCSNLSFLALDITSQTAWNQLIEEAARLPPPSVQQELAPVIIIGVHLCGYLSNHAVRLFMEAPGPAGLVLVPCCLDGRQSSLKKQAKKLRVDPHRYWCLHLLMTLPISDHEQRELFMDDDVISEKNSMLVATRRA